MDMKKCKECGKLFAPKSKNSVYCDAIHYRPCPVCGKLLEAKYLSDPPRTCSAECRKQARALNKDNNSVNVIVNAAPVVTQPNSTPEAITIDKPKNSRHLFELPKQIKPVSSEPFMNPPEVNEDVELEGHEVVESTERDEAYIQSLRENGDIRTYIGKNTSLKFIKGHEYALEIGKDQYAYIIEASYDLTAGKSVDLYMPLSSQISIDQNFKKTNNQSMEVEVIV